MLQSIYLKNVLPRSYFSSKEFLTDRSGKHYPMPVVLNLFDSQHPSLVTEQFGGTPGYNLIESRCKIQKLVAPLELFRAPEGYAAPRLRTTEIECREIETSVLTIFRSCFVCVCNNHCLSPFLSVLKPGFAKIRGSRR